MRIQFRTKLQKVVNLKGTATVYQQTTAEKVEIPTVLLTINAAGDSGLSLEILKGVRLSDEIRKSAPSSANVNIPPLKLIREVRKRASAAKKSRLFMGDTSSDISTDPIPEESPGENSVIRPNRKKVRIQRSQSDNVENGTAGTPHESIPQCLTLLQKNKKQSRKVEKVVDNNELRGSCSGSFKDVIRRVYWIQCTNCDL